VRRVWKIVKAAVKIALLARMSDKILNLEDRVADLDREFRQPSVSEHGHENPGYAKGGLIKGPGPVNDNVPIRLVHGEVHIHNPRR
jgi:hypothetical protein